MTGDVRVSATVTNEGNAEGTGELWAEVILSDGESFSESRVVQVEPGETREYEIEIDIPITGFTSLGDATLDVRID